ncbi:hypothetical protein SAY87_003712 [Trapa incisa]|uniref:Uncharacterized protein n=1 Tax=Trapa incisa TaxID=236973 RepID=A0AAN7QI60_9MYRT|nr:hypothetical protein SAY87_003712 [Trapa incisa]
MGGILSLDNPKRKEGERCKTRKISSEEVLVPDFMESEHSYLVSGLLGKLHVITMDDRSNIVVMKADVQHNICPFQSTNSCPFSQSSPVSAAGSGSGSETGLWKVIARKVAFSTDLVSCQTLNI